MKLTKNVKGDTYLLIAAVLSSVCALTKAGDIVSAIRYDYYTSQALASHLISFGIMVCLAVVAVLVLQNKRLPKLLGLPLTLYWASNVISYILSFANEYQTDVFWAFISLASALIPLGFLIVTALTVWGRIPTVIPMLVFFGLNDLYALFTLISHFGMDKALDHFFWATALLLTVLAVTPKRKPKSRPLLEISAESPPRDYWSDGMDDYVTTEKPAAEPAETEEPPIEK